MWWTTYVFWTAIIVSGQLQIVCVAINQSEVVIAKRNTQILPIDLSTYSHDWNIIADNHADTIHVSVLDVKIGIGHTGFVGVCSTDFLTISDATNKYNNSISICGREVKTEWMNWESNSNNVSVVYTTKSIDRYGYLAILEYWLLPHPCRYVRSPCLHGECIDTTNRDGDGFICSCPIGYIGKTCNESDIHVIEATDESQNITVNQTGIWIITAEKNQIINISMTFLSQNEHPTRHTISTEHIEITDQTKRKTFNLKELQRGISMLSESNNVTIKSINGNTQFAIQYEARPDVKLLNATTYKNTVLIVRNSNKKYMIKGDTDHIINLTLSISGGNATKIPHDILDYIKIHYGNGQKTEKTISFKELVDGKSFIVPSASITVEYSYTNGDPNIMIEYQAILKKCTTAPCRNGGLCFDDETGGYNCTCKDGYDGENCEHTILHVIKATAESQNITVKGSGIWIIKAIENSIINISMTSGSHKEHQTITTKDIEITDLTKNETYSLSDLQKGILWLSESNNITIKSINGNAQFEIQYEAVPKKCTTSPCKHGGTCSDEKTGDYTCACIAGYEGQNCEHIVGLHCSAENYSVPFTEHVFLWRNTLVGSTDSLPCPISFYGNATRSCIPSNTTDQSEWSKPNLTACVSREIKEIHDETYMLVDKEVVTSEVIQNLTTRLTVATSRTKKNEFYPGDLTTVTRTVHELAGIVQRTTANSNELSTIAQGYGEAVGNIVDSSLTDVWTFLSEDIVRSHMLSILSSVEKISANVARKKADKLHRKRREISRYTMNETVHVQTTNLEFHISFHERIAICEDSYKVKLGDGISSAVTLTADVFKTAIENTDDRYIQVYNARFSSIADVIDASKLVSDPANGNSYINSDIVSSKILNIPEERFQNLQKPVVIMLEIKNKTATTDLAEKCVFVNMSTSDGNIWTDEGCTLDPQLSNSTHTACKCNHLTNFAILMDVFEVQKDIDYTDYTILTYITYIGGVMSTLSCIFTVIVFQCFSLRKERVRVHQQLAISIILVQVFFLVGIDRTENQYVCTTMAALLHYSVISMFCWMLIEGFHLYVMLVKVFRRKPNFKKYLLFGWGVPLVVVGVSVGVYHDQYGGINRCWLSHQILLTAFIPVVALVIVINTIILIIVLRIMMKSMLSRANSEERSAIKAGLKAAVILLPLLGITWTLGFFSVNNRETLVFTYLFTFFNSLQGVFFFVLHCLLNTDVKNAFERRSQRRSMTKLLTESLGQDYKTKKSSTLNTVYTNKSSVKSILGDETFWKKKSKYSNNDLERIHRDQSLDLNDKYYHHNLHRSISDVIPRWQDVHKEFQFYNGKDNNNILQSQRINKLESNTDQKCLNDFRIEDLYQKPIRKRIPSEGKQESVPKFDGNTETSEATTNEELRNALVKELMERTSSIKM